MLYDLAQSPPEPGTLLESVFLVLTKRRQEADFLKTRVLVEAALAPHLDGKSKISETMSDYMDALFPWIKSHKSEKEKTMTKALKQWTGLGALKIRPLGGPQGPIKPQRLKSSLARGRARVEEKEQMRRSGKLKKL